MRIFAKLTKIFISLSVTFTTLVGCVLATHSFKVEMIFAILGVFFLASSASALNQIQEWKYDALMARTKSRPLPSQLITVKQAWIIVIVCVILGGSLLHYVSKISLILGVTNIVIYNFVYTPLKRVTSFAVIPGSIVGAIPPIIGYTAMQESMFDVQILVYALFMFLWQIPHFWLLSITYSKDYLQAQFTTITSFFSEQKVYRLVLVWELSIAWLVSLFPIFGLIQNRTLAILCIVIQIVTLLPILEKNNIIPIKFPKKAAFISINMLMFLVSVILMIS